MLVPGTPDYITAIEAQISDDIKESFSCEKVCCGVFIVNGYNLNKNEMKAGSAL